MRSSNISDDQQKSWFQFQDDPNIHQKDSKSDDEPLPPKPRIIQSQEIPIKFPLFENENENNSVTAAEGKGSQK